jgi:hypothetical protein
MSSTYEDSTYNTDLRRLIGEVITKVSVNPDRTEVTFITREDKRIVYQTYGDCCSSTWVEHLTVPSDIGLGAAVVGVGQRDMEDDGNTNPAYCDYPEVIAVYETCWVTDKGEIIVEYRNNSNGYYGGSIHLMEDY